MLPSTGITTNIVKKELGETSNNIRALCTSNKINKWSRKKPVKFSSVSPDRSGGWYKANDGFCGLTVGWSTAGDSSLTNLVNAYRNGTWIYQPPTGGATAPYRLADFGGYDHNAVPFAESRMKKGTVLEVNVMQSNALTLFVYYNNSPSSVQITDFDNAGQGLGSAALAASLYDADPLVNTSANRLQTVVSSDTLEHRGTVTFNFTASDISTSRYVMLFLASTTVSNNMCLPYDDNNYFLFKVDIVQKFAIEVTPTVMGNGSIGYYNMSYWNGNSFPSNNGNADVILFLSMKNISSSAITVGQGSSADYALRTYFGGGYTTALTRCDSNGNALTDYITVNANSTFSGYYKAPRMFYDFLNYTGGNRGQLFIQAYNTKGGTEHTWQYVSPGYMVYVSK